ncbi:MAG TPA: hypothetical protein VF637_02895 [Sphingomicrobium sp.]
MLARLTEQQKGKLLGLRFAILSELAERLEDAWRRTDIDLSTMIVRRGNDSSTWNLFAGAWNPARDHWIALVKALGIDALLDQMLPGKVMRPMSLHGTEAMVAVCIGHPHLGRTAQAMGGALCGGDVQSRDGRGGMRTCRR